MNPTIWIAFWPWITAQPASIIPKPFTMTVDRMAPATAETEKIVSVESYILCSSQV